MSATPPPPPPPQPQRLHRKPDGPRRIKNGLRLRRREGIDNFSWPADAWLAILSRRMAPETRMDALDYARVGQTASLVIGPGFVEALVQGRAARPYHVRVALRMLDAGEWDRVVATMASEALWSAKLLSGELPQSIELLFRGLGRTLVPEETEELAVTCTCADANESTPCKHVGCAWMLAAERIETDPLLSFTLRGLDGRRLLERLQEARSIATRGAAKAHSTPPAAETSSAPEPVERLLADFWKPGRRLTEVEESAPDEHVPHALLRRLGPTPFQASANRARHIQAAPAKGMPAAPAQTPSGPTSKFPLVGLLASVYDSIAAAGRRLREDPSPESSAENDAPADGAGK